MTDSAGKKVVVAGVADLFFVAKIQAAAGQAGVILVEAADARQLANRLATVVPDLVILDLNCTMCEPLVSVRRIRTDPRFLKTEVLGFLAHVQKDMEREAREAGCDRVISRSKFSAD